MFFRSINSIVCIKGQDGTPSALNSVYIYIYITVYVVLRCNGENMLYTRERKKNTITKDPHPGPLLEISIGARYNLYSADVVCLSRVCEVVK